ncbi:MAG: HAD family hydrolase [Paracoccaceae bacterium]
MGSVAGLVFDKDGTLFDFKATWGGWAQRFLDELADGAPERARRLGAAVGFDTDTGLFAPDSPIIAHTAPEIALYLVPFLPGMEHRALVARMDALSATTELAEAVPLVPFFDRLSAGGMRLGLVTNDAETPARAHLNRAGVAGFFDFVAGADSGFGAKPDPGPLLAFADAVGLRPETIVMVGDSCHDLIAGKAAGMRAVGVLTGIAGAEELAPVADAVLPDIGHLPDWIAAQS